MGSFCLEFFRSRVAEQNVGAPLLVRAPNNFLLLAAGELPMNLLLEHAPEVEWEMDIAWIVRGVAIGDTGGHASIPRATATMTIRNRRHPFCTFPIGSHLPPAASS